jgi:N-acetylneuraminic acid mutarotase
VTKRIRSAAAALLFLGCLVTLTSAFNLPNKSADLSSRLVSLSTAAKPPQQRTTLTFAERVAYQRAIEEVHWRHRIWPKDNARPKPSLDKVMSQAQIEKKVEDYLRNSQALEDYWQRPITPDQLQAEMERMASHTLHPRVLLELFQALANDPFVIAECLARPLVAERLTSELRGQGDVEAFAAANAKTLTAATALTSQSYKLPQISVPLDCTDDTWTATSTVNAPDAREFHTVVWTGSEMIVWGGFNSSPPYLLNTGGRYDPATDIWAATSMTNAPTGRGNHTAVWTGTEMIVWGGQDSGGASGTGGKYNPSTDSWSSTGITNAPHRRFSHTAVWTGSEMVVWAGFSDPDYWMNTGGRYDPSTDSWTATSTTNAPEARWDHTVEWTGSEMIVWGGTNQTILLNTGAKYNPTDNSWTATSTANAPLGRIGHTAVWSGSEMMVWAGTDSTFNDTNTGGRYNPTADSWTIISTANAPPARDSHTAVWTGSEMIVWGGIFCSPCVDFDNGGRYNPGTDSWAPTNTANAPFAREHHTAVWTGSEMIAWGGYNNADNLYLNTGGRYCAQSQAPMAQSAFSRKTHGAAGTFDIPLSLTGNVGIECRSGGATNNYQMIINFATSVTVGSASVTSGTGGVSGFSVSGTQVTVNLTGVTNAQRITVTLLNVNDGTHMGDVPVSMGVLVGDVNGNAIVNATDVSLTKSQVGQPVSGSNFREDVNANGMISATDVAQVKSEVGTALPP